MQPQDVEVIDLTGLSLASLDGSASEMSLETTEDTSVPWYQDPNANHPFSLSVKGRAPHVSASRFTDVDFFPWGDTPLEHLWDGRGSHTEETSPHRWQSMRTKWKHVAAICGGRVVRLINTSRRKQGATLFQISLPADCPFSVSHVQWALNPRNFHPLIIYVHSSVLHVFDVEARRFLGCRRGHGADITSLGVHRQHPHLVYTTSRDCTTRIYDFSIALGERVPQDPSQKRRKIAFERAETDDGNSNIGKCVVILTGGRSGGHEAAVLGADFHPSLPIIATCGIDHAVRIWHLKPQLYIRDTYPPGDTDTMDMEDKPLFSSSLIHDARVLSVHWLSVDLLLSHSAPTTRAVDSPGEANAGTLAVWQWLSVGRFFPPEAVYRQPALRGCISDYRESSSYKMISLSQLPVDASRMSVQRLRHGPPLILFTIRSKILILNASQLSPRNRPVLQDDRDRGEAPKSRRIRLSGAMAENTHTDVEGWSLSAVVGEDLEDEILEGCALSPDGDIVAAVGRREGVWVWNAM